MTQLQTIVPGANAHVRINEVFATLSATGIFGLRQAATTGLAWGYYGGLYNGNVVADGTVTLTDDADNYIVASRATGAVSVATGTTNWDNLSAYARVYKVTTADGSVTAVVDHRMDTGGLLAGGGSSSKEIVIACSDETTALAAGSAKVTLHMPIAMVLDEVMASLTTPQASGSVLTVDINKNGASILSTKLTVDNTEETSLTAATPAVISDTDLPKGAKVTIDLDQVGDGTATGLKVSLIGRAA